MKISCANAGKRFNRDWVFRHINYEFSPGNRYAITGPNGSGKSTLLQILAGAVTASEGAIGYALPVDKEESAALSTIGPDHVYRHISLAAPYLDIVEEMTLTEFFYFHQTFKPFLPSITVRNIVSSIGLQQAAGKQIRYYSSGMKQRVRLAQAIFSHTPCLLLDEPCSNLDLAGIRLYHQLIREYAQDRLIIVSSNDEQEYSFCEHAINILDFKLSEP
ncbi:MAG: ATP-binding cassette domain-containing protein [Williamsia sp.]|nr:ATP-binding cassette domain-containing protein [Williamsia sp.]